jgi:hypothetical protein
LDAHGRHADLFSKFMGADLCGVTRTIEGASTPYGSGLSYNADRAPLTIPFNNGITETYVGNDRLP